MALRHALRSLLVLLVLAIATAGVTSQRGAAEPSGTGAILVGAGHHHHDHDGEEAAPGHVHHEGDHSHLTVGTPVYVAGMPQPAGARVRWREAAFSLPRVVAILDRPPRPTIVA